MVTGRPAFEGKTRASLLGAILKDEPPRVSQLQPRAPAALDRLVATCLAKNPDDRFQTARDLLRDLRWIASGAAAAPAAGAHPPVGRRIPPAVWAIVVVLSLAIPAAALLAGWLRQPPEAAPMRLSIVPPPDATFGGSPGGGTGSATQLAVSPDGRQIVFVATNQNAFVLWLRPLDALAARPLAGTEGAMFPFWSPDSQTIGFFAGGKLKKVAATGAPPVTLCDAPGSGRGGTWNADHVIVFSPGATGGLQRVSAAGGSPVAVTTLDASAGEINHRYPHFLPDGRRILYTAVTGVAGAAPKPSVIKIASLDSTETMSIMEAESSVAYASNHLLFVRDRTLMALPFDPATRRAKGDAFPIAERLSFEPSRYASFSASTTGVLVYSESSAASMGVVLTWYDRTGHVVDTVGNRAVFSTVALSPDDRRAAVSMTSGPGSNTDVWIFDLVRAGRARVTADPGVDLSPVWSPDGMRVAFEAMRPTMSGIRAQLASGAASDERLLTMAQPIGQTVPTDWSRDGRFIAYTQIAMGATPDIWILPLFGDRKPFPFVATAFSEDAAQFSPDGRWIAYTSNESGQAEDVRPAVSRDGRALSGVGRRWIAAAVARRRQGAFLCGALQGDDGRGRHRCAALQRRGPAASVRDNHRQRHVAASLRGDPRRTTFSDDRAAAANDHVAADRRRTLGAARKMSGASPHIVCPPRC